MKLPVNHYLLQTCLVAAISAALTFAGTANAAKNGYYKWTDETGKVQFTQTPPDGKASVFVATATGKQSKTADEEPVAKPSAAASNGQPAAPIPAGKMEALPEKDPAKCAEAKANLTSLQSKAQIRLTEPDGKQRFLSADERKSQTKLAEDNVAVYCGK